MNTNYIVTIYANNIVTDSRMMTSNQTIEAVRDYGRMSYNSAYSIVKNMHTNHSRMIGKGGKNGFIVVIKK